MKKRFWVLGVVLLSCTVLFAQSEKCNGGLKFKKHNFGIGVSTSLFDSDNSSLGAINMQSSTLANGYEMFEMSAARVSTYFSIDLDYRYRFSKHFALTAKLSYAYRCPEFSFLVVEDVPHYYSSNGETGFKYLEVPLLLSYSIAAAPKTEWSFFLGAGAACVLSTYIIPAGFEILDDNRFETMQLNKQNSVFETFYLGTSFGFEVFKHRLEWSLFYKYSGQEVLYERSNPASFIQRTRKVGGTVESGLTFFL